MEWKRKRIWWICNIIHEGEYLNGKWNNEEGENENENEYDDDFFTFEYE